MVEITRTIFTLDEHDLYPMHEEDDVPQGFAHYRQASYLTGALQALRPELWVTSDSCLYWEEGETNRYLAPDVAVFSGPTPDPLPSVWLAWRDAPLLFVGEVASPSSTETDRGAKLFTYEQALRVPEYLYVDGFTSKVQLWRLVEGHYQAVRWGPGRRLWSEYLQAWFGFDEDDFLRVYDADGRMILTHAEAEQRAEAEARRAEAEARRAEAEARRADEAERRLAEMTAELERLRGTAGREQ
jgi:Uma2 family endonuclease